MRFLILLGLAVVSQLGAALKRSDTRSVTPWPGDSTYPATRRSDHVDLYNSAAKGQVSVPDPYQWLEGNSGEIDQWTTAQGAFTRGHLDKNPDRQRLQDEINSNFDYAKVDIAFALRTYIRLIIFRLIGQHWRAMVAGTGPTTRATSLSRVCI